MIGINEHTRTRLAVLVKKYFTVIAIVLILLSAGGAYLTYSTTIDPGTQTEDRTVSWWAASGTLNHSANVTNNTWVFDKGTVLRDRPYYFMNASPVLTGNFRFGFDNRRPPQGNADVTINTTLVQYAVQSKTKERLWTIKHPTQTHTGQISGEKPVGTAFEVNFTNISRSHKAIRNDHPSTWKIGDVRSKVEINVTVNGTLDGIAQSRSFNYELPMNSSKDFYSINRPKGPPENASVVEVSRATEIPTTPSPLTASGSVALLLVPLAVLGCLLYGRTDSWFEVTDKEIDAAERDKTRSEFDAWITTGSLGATDFRTTVPVDSLEGLVDIAIDSDRRVIENEESGMFAVIDNNVRYVFTPEEMTGDGFDWSDESDAPHTDSTQTDSADTDPKEDHSTDTDD